MGKRDRQEKNGEGTRYRSLYFLPGASLEQLPFDDASNRRVFTLSFSEGILCTPQLVFQESSKPAVAFFFLRLHFEIII